MSLKSIGYAMEALPSAWEKHNVYLKKGVDPEPGSSGNLIVDGSSLVNKLYFSPPALDGTCGGQYSEFFLLVRNHFQRIIKCGFNVTVVIDGLTTQTNETRLAIANNNIGNVYNAVKQSRFDQKILPFMARQAFLSALIQVKIPIVVCDRGVEETAVKLACEQNAVLVSHNYNYYLADISSGFTPIMRIENRGISYNRFNVAKFCEALKMNKALLPVYAAILLDEGVSTILTKGENQASILEALDQVPPTLGNKDALKDVRNYRYLAPAIFLSKFQDEASALKTILDLGLAHNTSSKLEVSGEPPKSTSYEFKEDDFLAVVNKYRFLLPSEKVLTPIVSSLTIPEWLLEDFRNGLLTMNVMETIVTGQNWLSVFFEDVDKGSFHLVSRDIRRAIYGIIFKKHDFTNIKEWLRMGKVYTSQEILPVDSTNLPALEEVADLKDEERRNIFYKVLRTKNADIFSDIAEEYKPIVAALRYWIQSSSPKLASWELAVIIMLICRSGRVTRKQPVWVNPRATHLFAQWQSVVLYTNSLNGILKRPFSDIRIDIVFDGIIGHSIFNEIQKAKSIYPTFTKVKTNDKFFWKIYNRVTDGLQDSLSGGVLERQSKEKQSAAVTQDTSRRVQTRNAFDFLDGDVLEDEEESEEEVEEVADDSTEQIKELVADDDDDDDVEWNAQKDQKSTWADYDDSKDTNAEEEASESAEKAADTEDTEEVEGTEAAASSEQAPSTSKPANQQSGGNKKKGGSKPQQKKKKQNAADAEVAKLMAQFHSIDQQKAEQAKAKQQKKKEKKDKAKANKAAQ